MTRSSRLRIAIVIVLIAIVVGTLVLPSLFDWRATKAYARIARGDEETRVILYMGHPDTTAACGTQLQWDKDSLGANDGRCVRAVRYVGRRGVWVVGYSADAHVVSKYFETPGQIPSEVPAGK